ARERTVVRHELHLHRRLFDLEQRQDRRAGDAGDGLADGEVLHAGDRADVTRRRLGQLEPLQRLVAEQLRDAELLARAVAVRAQQALARLDAPGFDATDRDVAQVV